MDAPQKPTVLVVADPATDPFGWGEDGTADFRVRRVDASAKAREAAHDPSVDAVLVAFGPSEAALATAIALCRELKAAPGTSPPVVAWAPDGLPHCEAAADDSDADDTLAASLSSRRAASRVLTMIRARQAEAALTVQRLRARNTRHELSNALTVATGKARRLRGNCREENDLSTLDTLDGALERLRQGIHAMITLIEPHYPADDDVTGVGQANAELTYFFRRSLDFMVIASPEGVFKRVSPALPRALGITSEELKSKPFLELVHPDDRAATAAAMTRLTEGGPVSDFENRYRTSTGAYLVINWTGEFDSTTGLIYALGRDITTQRTRDKHNDQIIAAIDRSAIVAYTDPRGRITSVNDNFCTISGYSREELLGNDHRILNSGKHPRTFFRSLWRTIAAGEVWTGDIENRAKDGSHYFVRTVISPIHRLDGSIEQYIALRFDITAQTLAERRAAQERSKAIQAAKLASLGEMAAGIAHEINNPLAIVAGMVRALPKLVHDPVELADRMATIDKSVQRIAKIVRSLKRFSRRSETQSFKPRRLEEIVTEALALVEAKAKLHATTVRLCVDDTVTIDCDEFEMVQVIVNLVANAIDAVKDVDERWVEVRLGVDGGRGVLRVTDSGNGVPPEVRARLFEPFFTTKPVGEGTGLGLSISRGILDTHGASIELLDNEPRTCFEVRFPAAKEARVET